MPWGGQDTNATFRAGWGVRTGPHPVTARCEHGCCEAYGTVEIDSQPGRGCEVRLDAERAETDPKVFTKIHLHFVVSGEGLKANLVEHAIRRSHEKYCSATAMLASTAEITTSWEIATD